MGKRIPVRNEDGVGGRNDANYKLVMDLHTISGQGSCHNLSVLRLGGCSRGGKKEEVGVGELSCVRGYGEIGVVRKSPRKNCSDQSRGEAERKPFHEKRLTPKVVCVFSMHSVERITSSAERMWPRQMPETTTIRYSWRRIVVRSLVVLVLSAVAFALGWLTAALAFRFGRKRICTRLFSHCVL